MPTDRCSSRCISASPTILKLSGVGAATLIVTLYGATYNLGSWAGGIAADRFSRKTLLTIGLLGNAAAILGIGLSRHYPLILALAMAAGIFGTIFHPAANALATSHYPKSPGMAIGILGIGSGLGFFFGPQIAGWRAASARWHLWHVAQWQKPCVEMAIAGFVVGNYLPARRPAMPSMPVRAGNRERSIRRCSRKMMRLALTLMFRDFAGVAGLSLAAIYAAERLRPERRRGRAFCRHHDAAERDRESAGGLSDAAPPAFAGADDDPDRRRPARRHHAVLGHARALVILLRVSDHAVRQLRRQRRGHARARFAACARKGGGIVPADRRHVRRYGPVGDGGLDGPARRRARSQSSYAVPFALLGACMLIAAGSPPLIARLGPALSESPWVPPEEISPETMGAVP